MTARSVELNPISLDVDGCTVRLVTGGLSTTLIHLLISDRPPDWLPSLHVTGHASGTGPSERRTCGAGYACRASAITVCPDDTGRRPSPSALSWLADAGDCLGVPDDGLGAADRNDADVVMVVVPGQAA